MSLSATNATVAFKALCIVAAACANELLGYSKFPTNVKTDDESEGIDSIYQKVICGS